MHHESQVVSHEFNFYFLLCRAVPSQKQWRATASTPPHCRHRNRHRHRHQHRHRHRHRHMRKMYMEGGWQSIRCPHLWPLEPLFLTNRSVLLSCVSLSCVYVCVGVGSGVGVGVGVFVALTSGPKSFCFSPTGLCSIHVHLPHVCVSVLVSVSVSVSVLHP